LFNLHTSVPAANAGAIYGGQQVLDLHAVVVSDGEGGDFPVIVDDAIHFATYFADVSGNGRINASDAARVAQFAALLDNGFAASLNVDPILIGDISGNGRVNAADASRVAQFAALLEVPEIPPLPGGVQITGSPAGNAAAAQPILLDDDRRSNPSNTPSTENVAGQVDRDEFRRVSDPRSRAVARDISDREVDRWMTAFRSDEANLMLTLEEALDQLLFSAD
jgi:hypothetical protein